MERSHNAGHESVTCRTNPFWPSGCGCSLAVTGFASFRFGQSLSVILEATTYAGVPGDDLQVLGRQMSAVRSLYGPV